MDIEESGFATRDQLSKLRDPSLHQQESEQRHQDEFSSGFGIGGFKNYEISRESSSAAHFQNEPRRNEIGMVENFGSQRQPPAFLAYADRSGNQPAANMIGPLDHAECDTGWKNRQQRRSPIPDNESQDESINPWTT